jgi:oligosaccharide repeat unit polymerase
MLALVFTALFLLTAFNYYFGRSVFYPAFVFCAAWTLALLCLLVSGDMFFPLSAETLSIYIWGAFAFSVGSAVAKSVPFSPSLPKRAQPNKIFSLVLAALLVAFPFFVQWMVGLAANHPAEFFLQSARTSFVELMGEGPEKYNPQYHFFVNLLSIAPMFALIAWAERKGHTKRSVLIVVMVIAYHITTGARSSVIQLLLGLLCIEWLVAGRLKFKTLATIGVSILVIFGALATIVHEQKGGGFTELVGYIGGPPVAFDRVVRDPRIVPHNLTAASFFIENASKLGIKVDVPPRTADFVPTGPDRNDNVFTIYFGYIDVGMWLGCFLVAVQAFLITLIYRTALSKNKIAMVVYAYLFSCVALTTFSDWIMGTLNISLKLFALAWLLYAFPIAKARFARNLHESAKPQFS